MGFLDGAKKAAKLAIPGAALLDIARKPSCELRTYAEQRGLTHHGSQGPPGMWVVVGSPGDRVDQIFNCVEGVLPGGRYGVALHAYELEDDRHGFQSRRAHHGMTKIGVPVPAGVGSIQRMSLRKYPFEDHDLQQVGLGWAQVPPDRYGIQNRSLYFGANADRPAIDAVLHAAAPWLAASESAGPFATPDVAFTFGVLWLATKGYLEDAALDAACQSLCGIADALEQASAKLHPPKPFTEHLLKPLWINEEEGRAAQPANPVQMNGSQGLESAPSQLWLQSWQRCWQSTGMDTVEDALEFHRAFPSLPAPGQAIFVFGGTVPGTETDGRLVLLTDRAHDSGSVATGAAQMAVQAALTGSGIVNSGVTALMLPVADGATTNEPYEYGADSQMRIAIRDGVATFWTPRAIQNADPLDGLDGFIAAAVGHAKQRGFIP